jgi:hypothetical protein
MREARCVTYGGRAPRIAGSAFVAPTAMMLLMWTSWTRWTKWTTSLTEPVLSSWVHSVH